MKHKQCKQCNRVMLDPEKEMSDIKFSIDGILVDECCDGCEQILLPAIKLIRSKLAQIAEFKTKSLYGKVNKKP